MDYFITYSDYRIEVPDATVTFGIIFTVLIVLIGATFKRTTNSFFDIQTATSLRGVAVLFLLFGHLSIKCLKEKLFFNLGGYWAVTIFLFISGYGIYQSYQFKITGKGFWQKRILKLYPPLWISLILFIVLDGFLLDLYHPLPEIILNFTGVHLGGVLIRINASAWFVEYIMVLYFVYWLATKLPFTETIKLMALFLFSFSIAAIIYFTPIKSYLAIWLHYTIVFPAGVAFGKYHNKIVSSMAINPQRQLFMLIAFSVSLAVFFKWDHVFPAFSMKIVKPVALIIPTIIFLMVYEKANLQSTFLMFLGKYSYEIYLLHAPFMVKYDFFLFRKPLHISFFAYFLILLILSYLLAQTSAVIMNGRKHSLEARSG